MANLRIYTTDTCPFCFKAKLFLKENGIDFIEIEVRPGTDGWEEMREITGGATVPQILIDGEAIGGYAELVEMHINGKLAAKLGDVTAHISEIYDTIIIGGGPSGLSAGIYTARKVLKTLLISKNIGGQVTDTYDIENYLGFTQIQTYDLINKFEEHVEKYGIEKLIGESVKTLDVTGKIKKVTTDQDKTFLSKTVIIATGKRPKPLNVPGEKELIGKGVAYCSTCDAPLFAGADVAVMGGGNSALEAVIDLEKVASKIYLVSLTDLTGDDILQSKVKSFNNVEIFTKYETVKINGSNNVEEIEIKSLKNGDTINLNVEGIFIEIGLMPNSDIVVDTIQTNRMGEIVVDDRCKTGVAGVFACGDVTTIPYKQVIIAAGEGAKAALSVYDYLIYQK